MQFSDETLMAYADGEVDAETRRQIETAMTQDPTLAERVAKHRALRTDLGAAFGGVLDEPIPARLLDAANSSPATRRSKAMLDETSSLPPSSRSATTLDETSSSLAAKQSASATDLRASLAAERQASVVDLNAARAAKSGGKASRKWSWPEWTAIAASLLIGVLAGRSALQPSPSEMFATTSGGIVATGDLSAALSNQLSGTEKDAKVQIGLTFRSKGGDYCRSFTAGATAGFACREDARWHVRALNEAATQATNGEYRMAGSELPPAVLAAIDDVMEGEALDREQEQSARERGWNE